MVWWDRVPIADALAGQREVTRTIRIGFKYGAVDRAGLYAVRDKTGLSRREAFHVLFPEPDGFAATLGLGNLATT